MQKPQKSTKTIFSLIVFVLGVLMLISGIVFLVFNFTKSPRLRDAEYLVKIGTWERKDAPSVVWQFTEIGSGNLTTNAHLNDYDFVWAVEDDALKIETNWLYTLSDEYIFELDQDAKILTITANDGKTFTFVPSIVTDTTETAASTETTDTLTHE